MNFSRITKLVTASILISLLAQTSVLARHSRSTAPEMLSDRQRALHVLNRLGFARQALHAAELGFEHPISGQILRFHADLPADMRELIDELGRSNR